MRVLVVDDEPLARTRLELMLRDIRDIDVVGSVGDGESALSACATLRPDVLLLDVEMPALTGESVARRLAGQPGSPQVIFCTAYERHAISAFELGAVDYLLKPVRGERLAEALARARARMAQVVPSQGNMLMVRRGSESRRLDLSDVRYFVADEKYVEVHLDQGTWLMDESLRQIEQAFGDRVIRLHRNCLVPAQGLLGLKTLADGRVLARLAGTEAMPEVSRRNLVAVRQRLREA
ncbi:LytTR family DNA-binding domain-containing protein [Pinirhizobacter sp.]|jgi:two-component system response regulator AlgR|uniref:LytR/AlgR family response regulator transcription factor n=1 Tax=Pinirhizobacter sp. TaxID=2950432 RepID=UPI002F40F587